jgi:hypothetical protein
MSLCNIINETTYPIEDNDFREDCKKTLAENGALVLPDFLNHKAVQAVIEEGEAKKDLAWYTKSTHNVYLTNVYFRRASLAQRDVPVNAVAGFMQGYWCMSCWSSTVRSRLVPRLI